MSNWKSYKLSEVTKLSTGFAFKSKDYGNFGTLKVIRGINVTEGKLRWAGDSRFWNHSEKEYSKYLVELDDIVIGMDGSKIGKNRAIVRQNDLPSILAQRVARIQSIKNLSYQKYIWQLINNSQFENYINNIQTGTSIPHISLGQIGNYEIKLPTYKEQQSIASILSSIDDKIENNLAINKTLEEMAMALYKHWFVDFGPFQDGEFVESELGLIPKGWVVGKLDELAEVLNQKRIPLSTNQRSKRKGEFPYYGASGIIDYIDGYVFDGEHVLISEDGENLRSRSTPIAFGAFGKFWVNNHAHILKGKKDGINKLIICHFAQLDMNPYLTGAVQPKLNKQNLLSIGIPMPKDSIIVANVLEKMEYYSKLIISSTGENQSLTQLRDTLLRKLISGEIRLKEFREKVL